MPVEELWTLAKPLPLTRVGSAVVVFGATRAQSVTLGAASPFSPFSPLAPSLPVLPSWPHSRAAPRDPCSRAAPRPRCRDALELALVLDLHRGAVARAAAFRPRRLARRLRVPRRGRGDQSRPPAIRSRPRVPCGERCQSAAEHRTCLSVCSHACSRDRAGILRLRRVSPRPARRRGQRAGKNNTRSAQRCGGVADVIGVGGPVPGRRTARSPPSLADSPRECAHPARHADRSELPIRLAGGCALR